MLYYYDGVIGKDLLNTASTEGNPTDKNGSDIPNLANPKDSDTAEVKQLIPASVSDFVWLDTNFDGLQNATEQGLNGVTVNLLDGNGNPSGQSRVTAKNPVTNKDGWYEFANLLPGNYQIEFINPDGFKYIFTKRDQGTGGTADAQDSDVNSATGRTVAFTLAPGQNDLTRDAGLVVPTASDETDEPVAPQVGGRLFLPLVKR